MASNSTLYRILELPVVYRINQLVGAPTVAVYKRFLIELTLPETKPEDLCLEVGCGLGNFRPLFHCRYVGIDLNASYIESASARHAGEFKQMDCTELEFKDTYFDCAVSIATFHHLSDEQVLMTLREIFRVLRKRGVFHLIDPILPPTKNRFKTWLFEKDRGRYQRTLIDYQELLKKEAIIVEEVVKSSILHDVVYFRLVRSECH
jgi:ubiquinone/menaquinone biosynthesis C-methylase UbiE